MIAHAKYYLEATIKSYSIVFFSQNQILGTILLTVSFFNLNAGISGLISVLFSLFLINITGFCKNTIKTGLYTFNSLLLGIGFGTFFNFNPSYWLWLLAAVMTCVALSVILSSILSKRSLPILSIPFILTFWMVLAAANQNIYFGLNQKESYLIFELFAGSFEPVNGLSNLIDEAGMPLYVELFFRSISAILFQNNILAGIIISIGLLIHSRIGFSLLIIGFIATCSLNFVLGIYPDGISNYHLGVNFMMVAAAIGGFFLIPSWRSFACALISNPVVFVVISAMTKITEGFNLPILSMPFCLITLSILYFFILRINTGKLSLTTFQHYSPEKNLYQFQNGQLRLSSLKYLPIHLPFMGSWTVSQGYDGSITHKGDWSEALDFVITDDENKTYQYPGDKPEHYYCYQKPITACADGIVEEVIDYIEDNKIGEVNLEKNWGNVIVIRHLYGLYSKVSHLKHKSAKVKAGDFVKKGDILALCGNSGRSPEPHLHFQLQSTPYVSSKTLYYPISAFEADALLYQFEIPTEGMTIAQPSIDYAVKRAFDFKPGFVATVKSETTKETFEVISDSLNNCYFFSKSTNSVAYFVQNDHSFYFTNFYGDKGSLLYLFYLAAYRINFTNYEVSDEYPISLGNWLFLSPIQDFVAPFISFIKLAYHSKLTMVDGKLMLNINGSSAVFGAKKTFLAGDISINENRIAALSAVYQNQKTNMTWIIKD